MQNPQTRYRGMAIVHTPTLPVGLGNTLEFILLLDGVAVAATLGSVDQLFCQALSDRLDVAEGGLAGSDGEEGNGLVDTAEGRDIDGLTTDSSRASNTGRVFARTAVDNGVHGDLDGVLVGHDVDLHVGVGVSVLFSCATPFKRD